MFLRRVEWGYKNHPPALLQSFAFEATLSPLWGLHLLGAILRSRAQMEFTYQGCGCLATYPITMHSRPHYCNTDCHLGVDVIHFTNYCTTPPTPITSHALHA